MKLAIVIPTCRPDQFKAWLKVWQPLFDKHEAEVYVIEDSDTKSNFGLKHHWIRKDVTDFIPTHTGSIRSYGFLKAYEDGCDVITLDDDCLPRPLHDPIQAYLTAFDKGYPSTDYFDVGHEFGLGEFMRGFPFEQRLGKKPLLQYGGWDNVPDLDAVTQLQHEEYEDVKGYKFDSRVVPMPVGVGFTGCIMNLAIKHEALPMMYQLIMGLDRVGYDRWDDIWSGLFAKKICDHLGIPILINGNASIVHTRASRAEENLRKEQKGYALNEVLWDNLKTINLQSQTIPECYEELTYLLRPEWFGEQGQKIIDGMQSWINALSSQ